MGGGVGSGEERTAADFENGDDEEAKGRSGLLRGLETYWLTRAFRRKWEVER